jgi:hypothetical protein
MNRLLHLRETLPANINENADYPNVEFVVLNYNSKDDMDNWVRTNMQEHMQSGVLKYYKTIEPLYFDLSHSKNMVLKLASGDILCMVDADNFAGPNYVSWVNSVFSEIGKGSIITTLRHNYIPFRDQGGKLAFHRDLFHEVKGFDETMEGYGMDDVDLVNRLEKVGGERVFISNQKHLKFIGHSTIERLRNFHLIDNLHLLYLKETDTGKRANKVLYVLRKNEFIEMNFEYEEKIKNNMVLSFGGWKLQDVGYKKGRWKEDSGRVLLTYDNGGSTMEEEIDRSWKEILKEDELYYGLLLGYGECLNRSIYLENDKNRLAVNSDGWGKGTVYLNMDYMNPISVA